MQASETDTQQTAAGFLLCFSSVISFDRYNTTERESLLCPPFLIREWRCGGIRDEPEAAHSLSSLEV